MRRLLGGPAVVIALVACDTSGRGQGAPAAEGPAGGAIASAPVPARRYEIGRRATADEIRAWDIDANPAGRGLPSGHGTHARGALVYARRCASCHGPKGEGMPPNPRLIGWEPKDFSFATDAKLTRTIGNYWPYATTLYDYINRTMPFDAPGSLPPDDVYAVITFLLAENGVIARTQTLDARSLPMVRMPARDRFVPDDRTGGPGFR